MHLRSRYLFCLAVLLVSVSAFAQTTATLTGTVTTGGKPLPGVTVTVSSPNLQGTRTTVSGANGDYVFPSLPPGPYQVSFELEGMQKVTKNSTLKLAETSRVDAELAVSRVSEAITVTAAAPSVLETPQVSTNFDAKTIESLPVDRNIQGRVLLAPGVTNTGPNNQIVIHGAQSFDNLYLVNGVVVNENVRGQPQAAVIEDAIQETTLLTGGVSAEYGRFTGGVVSTITKSGGNDFTGSVRDGLSNDKWISKTAFKDPVSGVPEANHISKVNPIYEETIGGRIIRDRLWFFLAGRQAKTSFSNQTVGLNLPYTTTANESRYEAKLTGNLTSKHSIIGSYLKVKNNLSGTKFGNIADLASLRSVGNPISLYALHYNGVITNNFLLEAQWSKKDFSIVGGGAPFRDEIKGTLLRDISTGFRGWSPTFCGVCAPKERDNKDALLKASYFLSTRSFGSHNLTAGVDDFHQLRKEDNYQSGSDFRLFGDFIYSGGTLFLHLDPNKSGGVSRSHWEWDPLLGTSQVSDFGTKSAFVNDKWDFNQHWSFNAGLRYDKNDGENQTHIKTVSDSRVSPRIGGIFDVTGNGKHRISANYGRYVAMISQGPADSTSTGGRYSTYQFQYLGPEINPIGTPAAQLVPTEEVIRRAFQWFHDNGFTGNNSLIYQLSIPGFTEKIQGKLKSPYMDEITAGYGVLLPRSSFLRADVIHRKWSDFYVTRRDTTTGQNTTPTGAKVDIGFIENSSGNLSRRYNALQLQGQSKLMQRVTLGGNYTYAKLRGNVENEEFNNATVTIGAIGTTGSNVYQIPEYPEYTNFAQNNPVGYLPADIRHRANVWLQYNPPFPFGNLDLSLLQRYHSGIPYYAFGVINPGKSTALPNGVTNPGYALPPTQVAYFFTPRGDLRLDSIKETSFTVNYSVPISRASLFFKGDVINLFNNQGVEQAATSAGNVVQQRVFTNFNRSTLKPFNPFTDTPKECPQGTAAGDCAAMGANWQLDPNFGRATNKDAYQIPRTYRFAVGVRF
ncbi:MAG TPA: TonB-dependent receptor [Thermoanaerobaculia bacterium]|nr:TonB-dependent receptor [Thermoanaerobaculia bacterium]